MAIRINGIPRKYKDVGTRGVEEILKKCMPMDEALTGKSLFKAERKEAAKKSKRKKR